MIKCSLFYLNAGAGAITLILKDTQLIRYFLLQCVCELLNYDMVRVSLLMTFLDFP